MTAGALVSCELDSLNDAQMIVIALDGLTDAPVRAVLRASQLGTCVYQAFPLRYVADSAAIAWEAARDA